MIPVVGLVVTLAATVSLVRIEHRALKGRFDTACDNRLFAISRQIDSYLALLKGLQAFASAEQRDWTALHRYVFNVAPLDRDVVRYYWWNPRVSSSSVQPLEAYPEEANPVVFSAGRVAALVADASAAGAPEAAVLESAVPTCMIALPVRREGAPWTGEGVVAAFRIPDFVENALVVLRPAGVHVTILGEHASVLYRHWSRHTALAPAFLRMFQPTPERWTRQASLQFAGAAWSLRCVPIDDYLAVPDIAPCLILLVLGMVVTKFADSVVERRRREARRSLRRSRAQARRLHSTQGELQVRTREKLDVETCLKESEERFHRAYQDATVAIIMADRNGRIVLVNPRACELSGLAEEELIGESIYSLLCESDLAAAREQVRGLFEERYPSYHADRSWMRPDGSRIWVRSSVSLIESSEQGPLLLALMEDISGEVRARRLLEFQATHDTLTGLPNRRAFELALADGMKEADRHGEHLVLMYLDLDGFKFVNDSLGHSMGDALLPMVTGRLSKSANGGSLARVGGDEFTILLSHSGDREAIRAAAEDILDALKEPFRIGEYELNISASIGISVYPDDACEPLTLVQFADSAMYQAKRDGRRQVRMATPEMARSVHTRLRLEADLRHAIARGELELAFQPVVRANSHTLEHFEALCRWRHPELGHVSPTRFIPIAEETGLILPIGEWVLTEACRQAKRWNDASATPVRVAVNVSVMQLMQRDFPECVARRLKETGLAPHLLEVEVTESVFIRDADAVLGVLSELKRLGVSIALDDFGTGYSSLCYLRMMPLDLLKIDREFVTSINEATGSRRLIQSMIGLAKGLGLDVVSEGVENIEQARALERLGCDLLQGYLFSRPISPAEAEALVAQRGLDSLRRLSQAVDERSEPEEEEEPAGAPSDTEES